MRSLLPLGSAALLLLLASLGCGPRARTSPSADVIDGLAQSRSELDQAYDMVARMEEFERSPATVSVVSFLNNYLSEHPADPKWQPDSLVSKLPRQLRTLPPVEQLNRLDVQLTDAVYLEETYLLRTIGDWVTKTAPPAELANWVKSPEAKLDRDQGDAILSAYALFDWTIRNLQLDPLPPVPKDAVAGPTGLDPALAALPAPLRGQIGPGYAGVPLYVVLCGHGDAYQRMRVFTLLCRQQGLDVVTLSTVDPSDPNRTRPWVSGVLLGQQLYLFDAALGLPIPGPGGQGIATLEQVRADTSLLRALDVDKENPYDVAGDDIQNVTAQIDASLEALSQRMQIIEGGLIGDRQLQLTVAPSEQAERLRKSPGIANVNIWPAPIEATLFEIALRESPIFDPNLRNIIRQERFLLEQRSQMAAARHKHLRHQFSETIEKKGAKQLYLEARLSNELIDSLATNKPLQDQMGLTAALDEMDTPAEKMAYLESVKESLRLSKRNCSYWIGLVLYEDGDYKAAIDWLDQRTLQAEPKGFWVGGARYNLGRTYEQLAAYSLAQDFYVADESPQQQGNLVRAKRLSKLAAEAKAKP
ncbi:MAG TPA: hypothetical protein VL096_11735 [Pirellulaceae bacterium]|nr:hypothetical protein [Pirellulaceae bacterium]